MNWTVSYLTTRRGLPGVVQMESFYRENGGERELLTKGEKGLFLVPDNSSLGPREQEKFLSCRLPLLSMGDEEGPCD